MIARNALCLLQMLFGALIVVNSNKLDLYDLSEMMADGMNDSAQPCDNFYEYVCGNWARNFPRPDYHSTWGPDRMTMDHLIFKIKEILESPHVDDSNLQVYMEKQFYDSCLDTGISVDEGRILFSQIISESEQARPYWQNVAEYYATKIGEVSLFQITLNSEDQLVITKPSNTQLNKLVRGKLELNVLSNYLNSKKTILMSNRYVLKSDLDFQKQFDKFLYGLKELFNYRESQLIAVSIQDLQERFENSCSSSKSSITQINWLRLLQKLSNIDLEASFQLLIDFEYVKGLCALIKKAGDDVIVQYLQFNFEKSSEMLFHMDKSGKSMTRLQRSVECITMLPITSGYYKILTDNDEFSKREEFLNDLFQRIKDQLELEIRYNWMDDVSKQKALNMVTDLSLNISKLNYPTLRKELSTTSYNFDVTPVSLQNWINFKKAQTTYKFELSLNHSQAERRRKRSLQWNAFYESRKNRITLSSVFLFPPFFSLSAPIAYNFARLGFIIGHEISHAFDYLRLNPYFGYTFQRHHYINYIFKKKLKCVLDQFNQLGKHLHSDMPYKTLLENTADVQGIKLAYKAMERYFIDHPEVIGKNGFQHFQNFDDRQIFFMSFANEFCENRKSPMTTVTSHSPNKIRVIGSLRNMKEFGESFACQAGTLMNPTKKCDFWKKDELNMKSRLKYSWSLIG